MKETVKLEIRNSRKNTFQPGITQEEHYGTNPMENTGVPLQGFKGVPVDPGRGLFGVPIPGSGEVDAPNAKPRCIRTNKKGNPCGASPVNGTNLCIGHSRQVD